jgi:anthranilate synthase component I
MTELEFNALVAQGYNRIPLLAECMSDLDTPLSLYMKLANSKNSFLLESVVGGERFGRYSMIGLACNTLLRVFIAPGGNTTQVLVNGAATLATTPCA